MNDYQQESSTKKQKQSTQQSLHRQVWPRRPMVGRELESVTPTQSSLFSHQSAFARGGVLQTKLTVNEPDDIYEQEADQVAQAVMRMPNESNASVFGSSSFPSQTTSSLDRAAESDKEKDSDSEEIDWMTDSVMRLPYHSTGQSVGESSLSSIQAKLIHRACLAREEETLAARKAAAEEPPMVTAPIENRIQGMNGGGNPLPETERNFFESRMGADLSGVRVHTDSGAAQTSRDLNARAFTVGNNIAFNSGEYQPGTSSGRHLLAHELTHTIQQGAVGELKRKPAGPEAEEGICPVCGKKGKGTCEGCGQSFVPIQRTIEEEPTSQAAQTTPETVQPIQVESDRVTEKLNGTKPAVENEEISATSKKEESLAKPPETDQPLADKKEGPVTAAAQEQAKVEPKKTQESPQQTDSLAPVSDSESKPIEESGSATANVPQADSEAKNEAENEESEAAFIPPVEMQAELEQNSTGEEIKDEGTSLVEGLQAGKQKTPAGADLSRPLSEAWAATQEQIAAIEPVTTQPVSEPLTQSEMATTSEPPTLEKVEVETPSIPSEGVAQAALNVPEVEQMEQIPASEAVTQTPPEKSASEVVKQVPTGKETSETAEQVSTKEPANLESSGVPAPTEESAENVKTETAEAEASISVNGAEEQMGTVPTQESITPTADSTVVDEKAVVQRTALPNIQRLGLDDLMPDWVQGALDGLRGDAEGEKGEVQNEGSEKKGELDSDSESKGSEIQADGQSKESEIQAEGDSKGTELEGDQEGKGTELEGDQESKSTELDGDGEAKSTELEAEKEAKGQELQTEGEAKEAELQADAESKSTELQTDAESKTQELEGNFSTVEQEASVMQNEVSQEVESKAGNLESEAQVANTIVETNWGTLQSEAETVMQSLDAEAGELCSSQQGQAEEILSTLDPLIDNAEALWQQFQDGAKQGWDAFMNMAQPMIDALSEKWQQFSSWASENIWAPLKEKVGQFGAWVGEKASEAYTWMQDKWAWLTEQWDSAQEWLQGRADAAREWIMGKADAAREWIRGKADGAREWITGKADEAREWITGKAEAAHEWITGKASAANEWITGQTDAANQWITDKTESAREWINGKADAIVNSFRETGQALVSNMSNKAREAINSISSGGGPIMQWFAGIVNSLISGVESVGNSAVGNVSNAMSTGLNKVEGFATGAIDVVSQMGTSTVNFVADKGTGAVNFVTDKATGAVNVVEQKATSAVNFVEEKATGAVNWVEGKATGVVNTVETKGLNAVGTVEGWATSAVELAQAAWEGLKQGWDTIKSGLGNVASWLWDKTKALGSAINDNIIQPGVAWIKEQWGNLKSWVTENFPGLVACWELFKEFASATYEKILQFPIIGDYIQMNVEILQGMLLGDMIDDPNGWNILGQVIMGFIPVAGQVADVRDLVTTLWKAANGEAGWLDISMALAGFIPGLGDAAKGGKHLDKVDEVGDFMRGFGNALENIPPSTRNLIEEMATNPATRQALETYPEVVDLLVKYGDDIGPILAKNPDAARILAQYGDEGVEALTKYGDEGVEVLQEYGDEGFEMLQNGVRAKVPTPDGHQIKVLADGRIVRCSDCGMIRAKYAEELTQNPELTARLDEIEAMGDSQEAVRLAQELDNELFELRRSSIPEGAPGSAAHKELRWQEYQENGGEWSYERWNNVYEANMSKAADANKVVDNYHTELGWGQREVTIDVEGTPRRLDIAESATLRGIEHKTGYITNNSEIRSEWQRDAILVQQGWDITWVFEGTASEPLLKALQEAGIKVEFR